MSVGKANSSSDYFGDINVLKTIMDPSVPATSALLPSYACRSLTTQTQGSHGPAQVFPISSECDCSNRIAKLSKGESVTLPSTLWCGSWDAIRQVP